MSNPDRGPGLPLLVPSEASRPPELGGRVELAAWLAEFGSRLPLKILGVMAAPETGAAMRAVFFARASLIVQQVAEVAPSRCSS